MILWGCTAVIGLILFQFVIILIRFRFYWKDHTLGKAPFFPSVSVLISARNEEQNLPALLDSLSKLDYPTDKLQVLFADDQSEDNTAVLIRKYCAENTNWDLVNIDATLAGKYGVNGKANALAILSERATGEFYFFTDADCVLNPDWIKTGVTCFDQKVGLVLGITQVDANTFCDRLEEIDWWNTLGLVKAACDADIPTTGLGNNMVIKREAYEASGGFQKLNDSLTEDLELSKAVQRAGYRVAHQVSPGMLLGTQPVKNLESLLNQRKRWMSGVVTLPWYWLAALSLQFIYFQAVLLLCAVEPLMGVMLGFAKIFLQGLFLRSFSSKTGQEIGWIYLLLYDFYYFIISTLTILYYFWPSKTKWKSRHYS